MIYSSNLKLTNCLYVCRVILYFEVKDTKDYVCERNSNKNSLFATDKYSLTNFVVRKVFIDILFSSLLMHLHMNTFIMCLDILP